MGYFVNLVSRIASVHTVDDISQTTVNDKFQTRLNYNHQPHTIYRIRHKIRLS